MSEYIAFVLIFVGMIMACVCVIHWDKMREKIAQILREELDNNDDQSDSEDSGEVRH